MRGAAGAKCAQCAQCAPLNVKSPHPRAYRDFSEIGAHYAHYAHFEKNTSPPRQKHTFVRIGRIGSLRVFAPKTPLTANTLHHAHI